MRLEFTVWKNETFSLTFTKYVDFTKLFFAGRNYLFDQEIERVDWAEPEPEVDEETMKKVINCNL